MRSAILSTFPPRPCGIGVFSSDMRAALLETPGIDDVELLVVVDEPSSPQHEEAHGAISAWEREGGSAPDSRDCERFSEFFSAGKTRHDFPAVSAWSRYRDGEPS